MIGTLTNELNLPEPIVNAIKGHDYSYSHRDGPRKRSCDFTTTQLIAPVRITTLLKKHGAQLTEDASDRIFSLFGNAIHAILEAANDVIDDLPREMREAHEEQVRLGREAVRISQPRYIVEKRFYADFAGGRVGGRIDVYEERTGTLDDYKICSRYVMNDGIKPEWIAQASINATLMRLDAGLEVKRARIIAMYRDWSKLAARRERGYPQRQVEVFPVPLWSTHETLIYIQERITALRAAEANGSPVCTEDERWHKPDVWALRKKGNKRATKLFENEQKAIAHQESLIGYVIESRPGEDTRCLNFCPVTAFCSYFRELMEVEQK